jgi:small subunit ribosomal protein S6
MRQRLYEGMFIISATLSDQLRKKALDKILDVITSRGGEIQKIHEMGRKKLAYTIEKKKEGNYYLIYFSAPTPSIKEMWHEYQLNEDLLRFMTKKTDKVKETLTFEPVEV